MGRKKDTYRRHPTAHYICAVVLENLRKVIAYVRDYEDDFAAQVIHNEQAAKPAQQAGAKRQYEQQARRIKEIDTIILRLYEDNVCGKLSDERFAKMTADYEQEQRTLETSTARTAENS